MRGARILLVRTVALATAVFARQQQTYVIDPSTGQPVRIVAQPYVAGMTVEKEIAKIRRF